MWNKDGLSESKDKCWLVLFSALRFLSASLFLGPWTMIPVWPYLAGLGPSPLPHLAPVLTLAFHPEPPLEHRSRAIRGVYKLLRSWAGLGQEGWLRARKQACPSNSLSFRFLSSSDSLATSFFPCLFLPHVFSIMLLKLVYQRVIWWIYLEPQTTHGTSSRMSILLLRFGRGRYTILTRKLHKYILPCKSKLVVFKYKTDTSKTFLACDRLLWMVLEPWGGNSVSVILGVLQRKY